MRAASYPVEWTEDELGVGWLAPHRLLVFASIVAPQDEWNVTAAVDGVAVRVMRSYTSRHAVRSCFQGFFVDLSGVVVEAGQAYRMVVHVVDVHRAHDEGRGCAQRVRQR